MERITIKTVVESQRVETKKRTYNTDLFVSDTKVLEEFSTDDYNALALISTDTNSNEKLTETIVAINSTNDAFLISAVQQKAYNSDDITISYFSKELTLQGFNYFTKDLQPDDGIDFDEYYNMILLRKGFDITMDDIRTLGEYKEQFNCTILQFEANDNKYYLTINKLDQLSKITIKPLEKTVQDTQEKEKKQIRSLFS